MTSLIVTLVGIKRKSFDINCRWLRINFEHQQQAARRVEHFSRSADQNLKRCLDHRGSINLFALIILVLALLGCWICLANVLYLRKSILQREQILACTSWLEGRCLNYTKKMDQLNSLIKNIKVAEEATKITVVAATALRVQRLLLELKQQQLTLSFVKLAKMPFTLCKNQSPQSIIAFQHVNLFLIRNPISRMVNTLPLSIGNITLENFKMNLSFYHKNGEYQFKRFLLEQPLKQGFLLL